MAEFSNKAMILFKAIPEEEQEKALSILNSLEGLEVESANWILDLNKVNNDTKQRAAADRPGN